MPILHRDVAQYSEQYDELKLGIPTSSNFHKIVTPQGKPSDQWLKYASQLIAERLLQRKIDFYRSPAMERGLIVEAEAVAWYEFDHGVSTDPIGFITDDDGKVGCTPDRLVGNEGLLEAKAPLPHTEQAKEIVGLILKAKVGASFARYMHWPHTGTETWAEIVSAAPRSDYRKAKVTLEEQLAKLAKLPA